MSILKSRISFFFHLCCSAGVNSLVSKIMCNFFLVAIRNELIPTSRLVVSVRKLWPSTFYYIYSKTTTNLIGPAKFCMSLE